MHTGVPGRTAARYIAAAMIRRLGSIASRVFYHICPDPFVIAILLTILTAILALTFGEFPTQRPDQSQATKLLDAWRSNEGLWKFLSLGMQMCLILVTGHALAAAPRVRRLIDRLARLPKRPVGAVGLVAVSACATGIINWGLGLIVGGFMAREVGRNARIRGLSLHYPLLAAAGYMGLLVWHGGLSGSAPLSMTTPDGAARVLPAAYVERLGVSGVGLDQTLFSGLNLFVSGGLVVGIPILLMLLAPKRKDEIRTIEQFLDSERDPRGTSSAAGSHGSAPEPHTQSRSIPDLLSTASAIAWLLAIPLLLALVRYAWSEGTRALGADAGAIHVVLQGLKRIGLNEINTTMFALGLILHGSPRAYMRTAEAGARGCAGIIIQFPLYGGIMAMMVASGLVSRLAQWFADVGTERTIPLLSFLCAGIVNLFVPSGGGQWGIQGPVALETALTAGIDDVGKMIMAVAYGDQLTNMLQPFWALPLLSVTGVQARDIVGYTAVTMLFAGIWMVLGLLVF
jgi:short-chain fatty acids transporter